MCYSVSVWNPTKEVVKVSHDIKLKKIDPRREGFPRVAVMHDGRRLGTVEKFERHGIKQYRFLCNFAGLLDSVYVAVESNRSECIEKGVDFMLRAINNLDRAAEVSIAGGSGVVTPMDMLRDLVSLRLKINESTVKDAERLGYGRWSDSTYKLSGQADYIMDKLSTSLGYDRQVVVRVYHRNIEDWQQPYGATGEIKALVR